MSEIIEQEITVAVVEASFLECGYYLSMWVQDIAENPNPVDGSGDKIIHRQRVTIEVPDFDPAEVLAKNLERERTKVMAQYSKDIAIIDEKIAKLTALPAPEMPAEDMPF